MYRYWCVSAWVDGLLEAVKFHLQPPFCLLRWHAFRAARDGANGDKGARNEPKEFEFVEVPDVACPYLELVTAFGAALCTTLLLHPSNCLTLPPGPQETEHSELALLEDTHSISIWISWSF